MLNKQRSSLANRSQVKMGSSAATVFSSNAGQMDGFWAYSGDQCVGSGGASCAARGVRYKIQDRMFSLLTKRVRVVKDLRIKTTLVLFNQLLSQHRSGWFLSFYTAPAVLCF